MLDDHFLPNTRIPEEIWNIPKKMFVALGMVLTVVEDMRCQEHAKNLQMHPFSSITSRLLGGASVDSLCGEVTAAITEVTDFPGAIVFLGEAGDPLRLTGSSGLPQFLHRETCERVQQWTAKDVENACARGRMIGENAFVLQSGTDAARWRISVWDCGRSVKVIPVMTVVPRY